MKDFTFSTEKNEYKKLYDILGKKFNKWTVLKRLPNRYGSVAYWLCQCECGNLKEIQGRSIVNGHSKMCINCKAKLGAIKIKKHGHCSGEKSKEYHIWRSIKERCLNPNNKAYKNYGGRGISICERWKDSFENFINDIGRKPFSGASIDRIDNNKGYFLENVKWVTRKEQAGNTRKQNILINGKTKKISDLEKEVEIHRCNLIEIIRQGLTLDEIIHYKSINSIIDKMDFRQKNKKAPAMIGDKFNLTPSSPEK